jgi:hypothetical protein
MSEPTLNSAVETAFSLGWQMARLFESPESPDEDLTLEADLPGLSALPRRSKIDLGLTQADDAIAALQSFLGAKATSPSTNAVRKQMSSTPSDVTAIRKAILELHVELLVGLTAADFRLGKAYGLGRALADTCAFDTPDEPSTPDELRKSVAYHLERHRALTLVGWLDDLRTVLPDHTGKTVADSLQRWVGWWETTGSDELSDGEIEQAAVKLHRQGQRWRAVLSGEKASVDLLETGDYLDAAFGMLRRAGQIVWSFARRLWAPLIVAGILLGVGIALMFADNSTGQVLAGLGTVAAGLGITWRSATTSLGHISRRLGDPLWGAELDRVIADRLTSLPKCDLQDHSQGEKTPKVPGEPDRRTMFLLAGLLAIGGLTAVALGAANPGSSDLASSVLSATGAVCLLLAAVTLVLLLVPAQLRATLLVSAALLSTLTIGLTVTVQLSLSSGQEGKRGLQGARGPTGEDGSTGKHGPTGERGPMGAQGPTGKPGPTGSRGYPGSAYSFYPPPRAGGRMPPEIAVGN